MFTSRAEHRLLLREDNADARLTPTGRRLGLVDDRRWRVFSAKQEAIAAERERLGGDRHPAGRCGAASPRLRREQRALELLKRPDVDYAWLTGLERVGPRVAGAGRVPGARRADRRAGGDRSPLRRLRAAPAGRDRAQPRHRRAAAARRPGLRRHPRPVPRDPAEAGPPAARPRSGRRPAFPASRPWRCRCCWCICKKRRRRRWRVPRRVPLVRDRRWLLPALAAAAARSPAAAGPATRRPLPVPQDRPGGRRHGPGTGRRADPAQGQRRGARDRWIPTGPRA